MATRAVSTVITYRAWDTSANTPKTGDSANHTLKWIKDGTAATPTNSPSEVDSTNAPGVYKLTLTSTETDCTFGVLAGKSGTANISIFGVQVAFEYVPTSSTTFGAFIGNATAALSVNVSGQTTFSNTSIATVTNLTNLPSIPANWLTATGIAASALNGKGDWLLSSSYTAPDNTDIAAIKAKTDNLPAAPADESLIIAATNSLSSKLGTPAGASVSADIAAMKSDTASTLTDAAAIKTQTDKLAFTVANQVDSNMLSIGGSAGGATALNNSTNAICYGTCSGGSTTTAIVSALSNPTSLTASGQLIGRTIIFLGSTGSGGLQAQASNITASTTGATPTITFTAMTTAPASGDKFVIL